MEYLSILIPITATILAVIFFKKMIVWQELVLMLVIPIILILITRFTAVNSMEKDTQYLGYYYTKAVYYQYWSTWVEQTCTRTYSCNCSTDSKGNTSCQTCTETYDCSYCDKNSEYWVAIDNIGREHTISREFYIYLRNKWKSKEKFIELNRHIDYSGSCGQDGDAYEINWNNDFKSLEAYTEKSDYINKTINATSIFNYYDYEKEEIEKLGLYDYPLVINGKQKNAIGINSNELEQNLNVLNGYYGKTKKMRTYMIFYKNKPESIGHKQRNYWKNGNQNEINICIGVDNGMFIKWVYIFSWSENKFITTKLKYDIGKLKIVDKNFPDKVFSLLLIETNNFKYRDMEKDFDYLDVELSDNMIFLIYFISVLSTTLMTWFSIKNEFQN